MTGGQFVGEARRQAYWITIEVWHRRVTSQKLPITSRSALWPFFVAFLFQAGTWWSGTSQSWFLNLQANCRNWRCNVVDHSRRTWPLICSFFQDNSLTFHTWSDDWKTTMSKPPSSNPVNIFFNVHDKSVPTEDMTVPDFTQLFDWILMALVVKPNVPGCHKAFVYSGCRLVLSVQSTPEVSCLCGRKHQNPK